MRLLALLLALAVDERMCIALHGSTKTRCLNVLLKQMVFRREGGE